jgi:DNA-binding transcriptional ArsR family regulator
MPMFYAPNVSVIAALIADPARALMLSTLLDGRALPAGELAYASGVTAQTASSHLSKLLAGGLVSVETEGRHRYYRLAGSHIAQALEGLAAIPPAGFLRTAQPAVGAQGSS